MIQEPPIPEKIGRYPVLRMLGAGAMGCVYLARDTQLDRDVAIKTVRIKEGAEAEGFLVRFRNEARAVGRLRHRSIVAVHDVGTDPKIGPYLVLEYVEGATLKEILRTKGPLSAPQMMALAEQVGEALDTAHREGIIHRDLKPDNLLVGGDGVVRLADFGVARVPDAALTGEGQFLGTPCYGAPETLRGHEADPVSEQFSFGAVLYEAVSGVRAFPGTDALAVAHAVIHDEPAPPSQVADASVVIPQAVDQVIMRALSKERAARFARLSDLVQSLRQAYSQASALSASLSATLPVSPEAKRQRSREARSALLRLWPLAAFLVAGAGFVVLLVVQRGGSSEGSFEASHEAERRSDTAARDGADSNLSAAGNEPTLADIDQAGGADAAADGSESLSAFEREELAKDALERARRALHAGDLPAAAAALDEASRLDPEHPDIASLRRALAN